MKRIIFILTVFLLFSIPIYALPSNTQFAVPVEVVLTESTPTSLEYDLWKTIATSPTFCLFNGHPLRVRIVIDISKPNTEFLFSAEWYLRNDAESRKFIKVPGGFLTGYFKFQETELAATKIIEYTEELLFPEETDDEYIEYDETAY